MGLTIHYNFNAGKASAADARTLVHRLHAAALDLPFDEVGEIVQGQGGARISACNSRSPGAFGNTDAHKADEFQSRVDL